MTDVDIAFVLGTRPEIIKLAPLVAACERRGLDSAVVHTGQHYSDDLDGTFFAELGLPEPTHNLDVGSGDHGAQTGAMLAGVERRLQAVAPDVVVVQGDTNSTLAGALVGSKLEVAVAHVEAGLRSYDRAMPEEINRVVADHVADYDFAPTPTAGRRLRSEGIPARRVAITGNTVVDAMRTYGDDIRASSDALETFGLEPDEFCLLTAHRAENVDDPSRFRRLLAGVDDFATAAGLPIVYPIHPRAAARLDEFDIDVPASVRTIDPLGYGDFLQLESTAALVFTDSGGVQEEACVLGTPCVTLRNGTERPETAFVGANCVAGTEPADVAEAGHLMVGRDGDWPAPFGDGDAATEILAALVAAQDWAVD